MKEKYDNELEFERDLISLLGEMGWRDGVLKNPTEQDLIDNWANILYKNNRETDKLGDYKLTKTEMDQILAEINNKRTPFELNSFINGETILIKRDNQDDKEHFGKTVSLKIYDRNEIAGGRSVYQIAEQPRFFKKNAYFPDRRGDFMLLINGMPLFHVELKRSGVSVVQAQNQIQQYANEGLFRGLFSLIQVFVAMTPEDATYFANPGPDGQFNNKFYFHWEDFENNIVKKWNEVANQLLYIPMAHQIIGFYTVADHSDGVLKVLRSYQYWAANKISDTVTKIAREGWEIKKDTKGGYIEHATGSGKTITSFKTAQLIQNSGDADKVVFLTDRIELGTQSLQDYRNCSVVGGDEVQDTEDTDVLRAKLKSDNSNDKLIVTSIQKMSRLKVDDPTIKNDLDKIRKKRLVIIIDECHRSVFGEMLQSIKDSFPNALFFGFSGTPIYDENKKKDNTTADVFGNQLHRYSVADAIRDGNVLGFDTFKVETFKAEELRLEVAKEKAKASSVEEVMGNEKKKAIFYKYMNEIPMASLEGESIENNIPISQYNNDEHRRLVCEHILKNWVVTSKGSKYHAILATNSIPEACEYYKIFKELINDVSKGYPKIKVTALFDKSTDLSKGDSFKIESVAEILEDYNDNYDTNYKYATHDKFKKDVASRLAHKKPYNYAKHEDGSALDLLIVVNQMLTGFDSKWINTVYLDKEPEYENIVQAFSRTNRLNDFDKTAGLIYYYRRPYTMELRVEEAFRVYSGGKPFGLFVDKLEANLNKINELYREIKMIFESNGIIDFSSNPTNDADLKKFVLDFNELCKIVESAKVQDFRWNKSIYKFEHNGKLNHIVQLELDENIFNVLQERYRELLAGLDKNTVGKDEIPPYDLDPNIITSKSESINYEWMEEKFQKFVVGFKNPDNPENQKILNELRQTFSLLSQEDQKLANLIINDILRRELVVNEGETLNDLINKYRSTKRDKKIDAFCNDHCIRKEAFIEFDRNFENVSKINKFGMLDKLLDTCDIESYINKLSAERGVTVKRFAAKQELEKDIINFVVSDCLDYGE